MTIEHRSIELEVHAKGQRLEGYAALFDVETRFGRLVESIAPGAFAGSLSGDVLALVDHDLGRMLARTRSKTLRLSEDSRGLVFDLDVPATSVGNDLLALAERGDLGGMSFGFMIDKDGETWDGKKRTLRSIDLCEISVVSAWPACEARWSTRRTRLDGQLRGAHLDRHTLANVEVRAMGILRCIFGDFHEIRKYRDPPRRSQFSTIDSLVPCARMRSNCSEGSLRYRIYNGRTSEIILQESVLHTVADGAFARPRVALTVAAALRPFGAFVNKRALRRREAALVAGN